MSDVERVNAGFFIMGKFKCDCDRGRNTNQLEVDFYIDRMIFLSSMK